MNINPSSIKFAARRGIQLVQASDRFDQTLVEIVKGGQVIATYVKNIGAGFSFHSAAKRDLDLPARVNDWTHLNSVIAHLSSEFPA